MDKAQCHTFCFFPRNIKNPKIKQTNKKKHYHLVDSRWPWSGCMVRLLSHWTTWPSPETLAPGNPPQWEWSRSLCEHNALSRGLRWSRTTSRKHREAWMQRCSRTFYRRNTMAAQAKGREKNKPLCDCVIVKNIRLLIDSGINWGLTYCPCDDNLAISTSITCYISGRYNWSWEEKR